MHIRIIRTSSLGISVLVLCCLFSTISAATLADIVAGAKGRFDPAPRGLNDITIIERTSLSDPARQQGAPANDTLIKIYRKGGRFRIESRVQSSAEKDGSGREKAMTSVMLYDGKDAWMMTPMFGATRIPRQEIRQLEAYEGWWDVLADNARIAGSETVDGRQCFVIDNADGSVSFYSRLWIDAGNYRLLRAQGAGPSGTTLVQYADFRDVKGFTELPYTIRTFTDNRPAAVTSVQQVMVNSGLPDSLFDTSTLKTESDGSAAPDGTPQQR